MEPTPALLDRACGAVLASAAGDALGAAYEFGLAQVGPDGPQMLGGGLGDFEPGEWTDDTTMAWCVLDVAATGADLRESGSLSQVAGRFRQWFETGPADIGNQTRHVLAAAGPDPAGEDLTALARDLHQRTGRTAGNGSLMRTGPVALGYLDDPVALAHAADLVGGLTHHDDRARQACVLWSAAVRHAVLHAELDVRVGLEYLSPEAADWWSARITDAEVDDPGRFRPNGWAVTALQAAWSAIIHTPVPVDGPACRHLTDSLATAIGIGDDTDTVAAIAGSLLGARWGASAVPAQWRRILHGYPGIVGEDLVGLAHLAATGGRANGYGWPTTDRVDYTRFGAPAARTPHPYDEGVVLADASALDDLPEGITAVVSLCLVGRTQVPPGMEHVVFRLIDVPDPAANPNLEFVLQDAARAVADLREQGHRVLVHCVAAQSRTPAVGIAYALLRGADLDEATEAVCDALPAAAPNPGFCTALRRLHLAGTGTEPESPSSAGGDRRGP